jgi:hypothetical protein
MCVYIGKKFSPEPAGQFQSTIDTNHSCMKGIQFVQIKGQGIIKKMQKECRMI